MKTDVNGCSTCKKGAEQWERFQMPDRRGRMKWFVQYDYRHLDGSLFTCVKHTLRECRDARDQHLRLKAASHDTLGVTL